MKIRALVSFSGILCMHKGQELECNDDVVLQDLIKAKYIEEINEEKPPKGVKQSESKRNKSK
ncbi:MAG TPA: hypothetical protein DCR77_06625 [Flavobacteriaceae bacterium]|nr:hypothetical protein [Flavobacteriaceae bacterium]